MRRIAAALLLACAGMAAAAQARAEPLSAPLLLDGTLGGQHIQAQIRPKPVEEGGVEGEYFVFGRSGRILLAGEFDGDDVWMEESENGTDVSGQWEGKREGNAIAGNWTSADGAVSKPFALKIIGREPARAKTPRPAAKPRP